MKNHTRLILLFCTVLVLAAGVWGGVCVKDAYHDVAARLQADSKFFYRETSDELYRAPGEQRYYAYSCSPLESLLIDLFFLGEEIPETHAIRTPLHGDVSYDSDTIPYFLRGSEDIQILIGKKGPFDARILVSLSRLLDNSIEYYCGGQKARGAMRRHNTLFHELLETVCECTDSTAITSIWVETRYGHNHEPVSRAQTITDPTKIDAVWKLLYKARFDCGGTNYDCKQEMDLSALYRDLNERGNCGLYSVIVVEFANDTLLQFMYYPETTVLFLNQIPFFDTFQNHEMTTTYPEFSLHFTQETMESLLSNLAL